MLNKISKNKFLIITLLLWSTISLLQVFVHKPLYDEAHAWTIAENSIVDIIKMMHYEGHTIVWYLLLMPFAKLHLFYPYSMQILNWVLALGIVYLIVQKSPFSDFIKFLIVFSYPFISYYPIIARCYTVGVLLLFLLAVLYKNKSMHPILYSTLLVLCANTSVMALFGATSLGLLFLYDFLKSKPCKKDLLISFSILFIGAAILLIQIAGCDASVLTYNNYNGIALNRFFLVKYYVSIIVFASIFIILKLKNFTQSLFFLISTYTMLTACFMYVYFGFYWHWTFYFIFFIISCWIYLYENPDDDLNFIKIVFSLFFLLFLWLYFLVPVKFDNIIQANYLKLFLNDKNVLSKPLILQSDLYAQTLLPYKQVNKDLLINYCEDKNFDFWYPYTQDKNKLCYVDDYTIKHYVFSKDRFDYLLNKYGHNGIYFYLANIDDTRFTQDKFIYKTKYNTNFKISIYKTNLVLGQHLYYAEPMND